MTQPLEPLRLEFDADELVVIAQRLGVSARLDVPDTDSLPAARVAAVERNLVERGVLGPDTNGTMRVDTAVGAVLGTCAFPSFSIVVTRTGLHGSSTWSIHYLAHMAVERRSLADERTVFTGLASVGQVVDRLGTALRVGDQSRPAGELIGMQRSTVEAVRVAAVRGERRQAVELLTGAGVGAESARALAQALGEADEISHLVALRHEVAGQHATPVRGVTLVRGRTGFWGFVQPAADSDESYGAPLSGVEVRALLTAIVALGLPD